MWLHCFYLKNQGLSESHIGSRKTVIIIFTVCSLTNMLIQILYSWALPYLKQLLGLVIIYIGLNIIERAKEECNIEREIVQELEKYSTGNHNKEYEENSKKQTAEEFPNVNINIKVKARKGEKSPISAYSPKAYNNQNWINSSKSPTVSAISHYKPEKSKKVLDKGTIAEILANFNNRNKLDPSHNKKFADKNIIIHLNNGSMKKHRDPFININENQARNQNTDTDIHFDSENNQYKKSNSDYSQENKNTSSYYDNLRANRSGDSPQFYQSFDENLTQQRDANLIFLRNHGKEDFHSPRNDLQKNYSSNKDQYEFHKNKENRHMADANKKLTKKSTSPNNVSSRSPTYEVSVKSPNMISEMKSQREYSDFKSGKDLYSVPLQYSNTVFSE